MSGIILTSRTHPSVNIRIMSSTSTSRKQCAQSTHPYVASRQASRLSATSTTSTASTLSQASTRRCSAQELSAMHVISKAYHAPYPVDDMTRQDSYLQHGENRDINKHLSRQCKEVRREKEDRERLRTKGMKWACHFMRV